MIGGTVEVVGLRQDGSELPLELSLGSWKSGGEIFFSATIRDMTERREFEERLAHQAFHDPLTGLPNRDQFLDRLRYALSQDRLSSHPVTVMFLDLDRFKVINDSLGHAAGDQLLVAVARRLRDRLDPHALLARFGGDEFTILLDQHTATLHPDIVAAEVIEALAAPFDVEHRELVISTSIVIAVAGAEPIEPGDLIREADLALYEAKARGRDTYAVFDKGMNAQAWTRLEREQELRRAIEQNELIAYFQPKVELASGKPIGAEALVRWKHPERGILGPADIIPLAEETGLIVPIGREVLRQACEQVRLWQELPHDGVDFIVCVNVSVRQIQDDAFVEDVAAIINDTGIKPGWLELELTESAFLEDTATTLKRFEQLKSLGVRLAIDDFGAGYSSLTYLQRLPVDQLKLDRSFIAGMAHPSGVSIVSAVLHMGEALGLPVVGEGVERQEQAAQLLSLGCTVAQGFYFSKPLPPDQLLDYLGGTSPASR